MKVGAVRQAVRNPSWTASSASFSSRTTRSATPYASRPNRSYNSASADWSERATSATTASSERWAKWRAIEAGVLLIAKDSSAAAGWFASTRPRPGMMRVGRTLVLRTQTPPHDLRVVIADDDAAFAQLLATLVNDVQGFEVVGIAADGEEAVQLAIWQDADVVLMDIDMPRSEEHTSELQSHS